jgi:hypothetical protein
MVDRLRSRAYPALEILAYVSEDDGHSSAYAASVSRALCVLYNQDLLEN